MNAAAAPAPDRPDGASGRAGGRRSATRLAAVQALYEMDVTGAGADPVLAEFMSRRWALTQSGGADAPHAPGPTTAWDSAEGNAPLVAPDLDYLADLVRGASARQAELDAAIGPALSGDWTVPRLEALLRAILRAGAYELIAHPEIDAAVVIDEYVEVAHAFFAAKEPNLVNAVLDRLARAGRA